MGGNFDNGFVKKFLSALVLTLVAAGLVTAVVTPSAAQAQARADIYPFDVKLGGQTAVIEGDPQIAIFAKVKNPVAADAELEVTGDAGLLLVNVFPVKPNGEVPSEAQGATKVIMVQSGTKTKLDATMDKSKLTPGLYGANIVFGGRTSRVMFTVK